MPAYSPSSLLKKLGLKPQNSAYVYNPPSDYFSWLAPLPEDVTFKEKLSGSLDFIHLFTGDRKTFERQFIRGRKALKDHGMLWVSWPKKSSGVQTDLNENIIRDFGLEQGLVDVKVCAVDDVWSGLKFVVRLSDRKG